MLFKFSLIISSLLIVQNTISAPMDWKGSFNFESNILSDVRRTNIECTPAPGSQCITPEENNARFQAMTIKLNPNLIVNDAVTIKGELSTGSIRTSLVGSSTQETGTDGLSPYAQSSSSALNINQIYAELYADTALYRLGRFSHHFGTGAIINDGSSAGSHYYSGYEGVEAQLKLGKLSLIPMWAKLFTDQSPNGKYDAYESSLTALYDDPNSNMKFGLYYSIRESSSSVAPPYDSLNTTLIDVYFSKSWNWFSFELEVPMLTGDSGTTSLDSRAIIAQTRFDISSKWKLGLNGAHIGGDDSGTTSFEAMYLHPNYKLSRLMFKYNYHAMMDNTGGSGSIFDSSMVNTTYAQFYALYGSDDLIWKFAVLWAQANQVATTGSDFYNHDNNTTVAALADQSSDLGTELELSFDYHWNPNVVLGGYFAYHLVGDYYSFANDPAADLGKQDVTGMGLNLSVNF